MGLFDERIAYKPFEYPEYYTEGWLKQAQAFWLHTEISMQSDIKDWKEKLNDKEKNLVGNILLGFAQTECAVSDYWTQKVVGWFPKHEIQQMAMMFGSQETVHAVAYSYLNETLKLEDYEAFLHLVLVKAWLYFQPSQKEFLYILLLQCFIVFNFEIYSRVSGNK